MIKYAYQKLWGQWSPERCSINFSVRQKEWYPANCLPRNFNILSSSYLPLKEKSEESVRF
jgi:hypothetical protein